MAPRPSRGYDMGDISFDLKRLFDPYNFDHIPEEERLALFKQRDLPHIKHYKAAVKIFGGPPRRTRAIVAPPMETPLKHRLGLHFNQTEYPPPPVLNGPLKPPKEHVKEFNKEEKEQIAITEKTSSYKSWIMERKKLRNNLNGLALNEAMLANKPDKTELEQRVAAKFKADREWKPESPPPREPTPPPLPAPDVPTMNIPPPDGLQILDKFLSLNRMRLIDLFKITDKDKSWSLSRTEFLNAVTQSDMPISEGEVDDMFIALDSDLDEELNFQELNKGLMLWRRQRRGLKKNSLGEDSIKTSGIDSSSSRTCTAGTIVKPNSVQDRGSSKKSGDSFEKLPTQGLNREESSLSKSSKTSLIKTVDSEKAQEGLSQEKTSSREKTASSPDAASKAKSLEKPAKPSQANAHGSETAQGFSREKTSSSLDGGSKSFERSSKSSQLKTLNSDKVPESFSREQTSSFDGNYNGTSSKVPTSEESGYKSALAKQGDDSDEPFRPPSQQKVKILDVRTSSESSLLEVGQTDGQGDKSLYEDMLFQYGDSPKVTEGMKDNDENEEDRVDSKTHTSTEKSARSQKAGSPTSDKRSRSGSSNSLEPPGFDTSRTESRAPESAEALLDIRKHDRVVLSRNTMRRNLSRDKRVTFDELPGVIKVGYKPIDDHCADSTLGGEAAGMVDQFRREKLREYFEVKKLFEERGIPMTQSVLDRVLLYPGDRSAHMLKKDIVLPLGPLTNEQSPFNQPKPKKKPTKRRRAFANRMAKAAGQNGGSRNVNNAAGNFEDDGADSASSKRSFITVEDVYPLASNVTPKVYKENLSSGRALITRKVDNWMTFEEYTKYTERLPNRFQHFNRPSNPDSVWPGYLLDKLRFCMPPYDKGAFVDGAGRPIKNRDSLVYEGLGTGLYNGLGSAVFQTTAQKQMAYPGYNNDCITWPVGPNGVIYGNIDEHRIIK